MQEEDEKSRASVNTNSYAAPIVPNVVNSATDNKIHPLLKPYCKPANLVRSDGSVRQIQTLRDTGAMQSILTDTHNSDDYIMTDKTTLLKGTTTQTQRVPLVQVHLRTDSIKETVLCGLVNELPNGIDFLIGNDIWLKAHPLPDRDTEQAVTTCSTTHKTSDKTTQCTSHLIAATNVKTSSTVTMHSKNDRQQCADNLSISGSHQSKKLSPAHSSNISVKSNKRRTQRTCHMNELKSNIQHNCAKHCQVLISLTLTRTIHVDLLILSANICLRNKVHNNVMLSQTVLNIFRRSRKNCQRS